MSSSNGSSTEPTANAEQQQWERESLFRFEELVGNAMLSRAELVRRVLDPRRNIEDECGHPRLEDIIDPWKLQQVYDRDPIGRRIVQLCPSECWQLTPTVYESEDSDTPTEFEEAWDNLSRQLSGSSYYQDEEGSPIWEILRRADVQSGVGSYGIILLGFDDGLRLDEPVKGLEELHSAPLERTKEGSSYPNGQASGMYGFSVNAARTKGRQLKYLRVFPESLCQIALTESNVSSPRYGQPVAYNLTLNDPKGQYVSAGMPIATVRVHWTRCIHVADNIDSSEVLGTPRMRPHWNTIVDLRKLYGGSAEMYWRGAFPGYSLETHPQLGGDVKYDKATMKDMMENWSNGLQRMLALAGWSMKSHAPQVADPTAQINVQLQRICILEGCPQRIFMGSERGELSSAQDSGEWGDRVVGRRKSYITPRLIVPFVDRLIDAGVLPKPSGYSVDWPAPDTLTAAEKADVALKLAQVLATYAQSGADAFFPPFDFLVTILKLDEEEAQAILKNAAKRMEADGREEAGGSPLLGLVGGVTGMIELFKLAKDGGLTEEQLKQQIMLFYGLGEKRADEMIGDGLSPTAEEAGMGMEAEVEKEGTMIDEGLKVDPVQAQEDKLKADAARAAKKPFGGR